MNYQELTHEQALELTMRVDALVEDMDFELSRLSGMDFENVETTWDFEEAIKALAVMEKHFENFRKKRLQMDEAYQWLQEED